MTFFRQTLFHYAAVFDSCVMLHFAAFSLCRCWRVSVRCLSSSIESYAILAACFCLCIELCTFVIVQGTLVDPKVVRTGLIYFQKLDIIDVVLFSTKVADDFYGPPCISVFQYMTCSVYEYSVRTYMNVETSAFCCWSYCYVEFLCSSLWRQQLWRWMLFRISHCCPFTFQRWYHVQT